MSIVDKWKSIDSNNKFLIKYPFWLLALFGLFYWGEYWSLSAIGKYIDTAIRAQIMDILQIFIDKKVVNGYEIVMSREYSVVITPECNGLIPFFIYLAGVLAYPSKITTKILWGVFGYVLFFVVNILRLLIVTYVVDVFGSDLFFFIHDIAGNILLIIVGLFIFKGFTYYADKNS